MTTETKPTLSLHRKPRVLIRKPDGPPRTCVRCGATFQGFKGGKRQIYCGRRCAWRVHNAAQYAKNRVPVLIRQRELMYGLPLGQYEEIREAQNGLCAICGRAETSRRTGRLSVDHDHETGALRGLLCNRCNRALGEFDDSPGRLRAAAAYLERHAKGAVA
jgi:hypothetical protein